ncbi:hypothetical protein [Cohnella boryungensis]|uniref:Adenylate/guanylate cyclase domain-containing protein n=1 Tax=Cohnella boryungensis TaxID=768479 RepID=A0ABV8SL81_9BACL
MHQAESARTTYEQLMEQTKLILQRKSEPSEHSPTEDDYAVLHLTVEASGAGVRGEDLALAQLGVVRFVTVMTQIVSGWGGKLIEASQHSYTAIFPMSVPDAASRCCLCGIQILNAIDTAINPSFTEEGLDLALQGGVGISMGAVFGFETGLNLPADSLYYGEAMGNAVEYANMAYGYVIVDKVVKEHFERSATEFKASFKPYRHHEWVGYRFDVG